MLPRRKKMFQNLTEPTKYDYELLKIIFRYMTEEERDEFQMKIIKSFSYNDLQAIQELAKSIVVIKTKGEFL